MNYRNAVAEGKRLVKRSEEDQWRLAELTWEVVQGGKSRVQWGRDIGLSKGYVGHLVMIWEKWREVSSSSRPTFNEAKMAVAQRTDDLGEARQLHYENQAIGSIRNMPPERKAKMARELLASPDVARRVVEDPQTRHVVQQATVARYREHADPVIDRQRADDRRTGAALDVQVLIDQARAKLRDALRRGIEGTLTPGQRTTLLEEVARTREVLDMIDEFLRGVSLDEALATILEDQS